MIITSSQVGMSSARSYSSYYRAQSATLVTSAAQAATLDFSNEAKSYMQQLDDNETNLKKQQEEEQQKNLEELARSWGKKLNSTNPYGGLQLSSKDDMKLQILKKMLEVMQRSNGQKVNTPISSLTKAPRQALPQNSLFSSTGLKTGANRLSSTTSGGTLWTKTTVQSSFFAEREHTAFNADGIVRTADGREISFNVTLEMSRAFSAQYESFTQENYILTDPLVINLDTNIGSLSDLKFLFDLDCDGNEEEISFAGKGSGFLALDKNGDGKINDGSELFGTQSGNGFADLTMYDGDGNGWIDEADSIFKDLRIWMKGENGEDILLSLKDANIGAIYLGSVGTEFHLNDAANQTNGVIQRTGIYLKEDGGVGTIQHIDLAV